MDETTKVWAEEWKDSFDQGYSEATLRDLVGKHVRVTAPTTTDEEGEEVPGRTFDFRIIGYTIDTIPTDEADVHRFSLITEDGRGIVLRSGTNVEDLPQE